MSVFNLKKELKFVKNLKKESFEISARQTNVILI
jgi:hypothetical protein